MRPPPAPSRAGPSSQEQPKAPAEQHVHMCKTEEDKRRQLWTLVQKLQDNHSLDYTRTLVLCAKPSRADAVREHLVCPPFTLSGGTRPARRRHAAGAAGAGSLGKRQLAPH